MSTRVPAPDLERVPDPEIAPLLVRAVVDPVTSKLPVPPVPMVKVLVVPAVAPV